MANKQERQAAILDLIERTPIGSQEELRQALEARGWQVTQATLSRDLRELGVVRAPTEDGHRYRLPERLTDESKPHLENLLPQLFSSIDGVSVMLVLHTLPSGAPPVSEAIDSRGWSEVLGTLAGENTVLIICRSEDARREVASRITRLAAGERN